MILNAVAVTAMFAVPVGGTFLVVQIAEWWSGWPLSLWRDVSAELLIMGSFIALSLLMCVIVNRYG